MRTEDFGARSDEDAVRIAVAMRKAMRCELWSRDRLVARIGPWLEESLPQICDG
jgi:hypothetical protein